MRQQPRNSNVRLTAPGPGHISGPARGIDRGYLAQVNPNRNRYRKTLDPSAAYINYNELQPFLHDNHRDRPAIEPHSTYIKNVLPPVSEAENPPNNYNTRQLHTSVNNIKAAMNCVVYSPDGRRVTTGSGAGEYTLWHGMTFNFDNLFQPEKQEVVGISALRYTSSGEYMLAGDEKGRIWYWTPTMSCQDKLMAHMEEGAEGVKGLAIAPSDRKFASCGPDGTVKVWDFYSRKVEHTLKGHANHVTGVSWHPSKSLIASSSKDNMVKIWDPKEGKELRTLAGHTSYVADTAWNDNGWWLLSAARDNTIRCYDIRMMKLFQTMQSDHKGITSISWHPFTEKLFVCGCTDGAVQFWSVGYDYPQAEMLHAHDSYVWDFAWHPAGSVLVSVSADYSTKFWGRSRPGDTALQYAYQGNPSRGHPPRNNPNLVPVPLGPEGHGVVALPGAILSSSTTTISSSITGSLMGKSFAEISAEDGTGDNTGSGMVPRKMVPKGDTPAVVGIASGGPSKLSVRGPPSTGYICKFCNQPGHWIEDCEGLLKAKVESGALSADVAANALASASSTANPTTSTTLSSSTPAEKTGKAPGTWKPPKAGYVCKKCGIPGHWLEECPNVPTKSANPPGMPNVSGTKRPPPNYSCHLCGSNEHYKNDCPTLTGASVVPTLGSNIPPPPTMPSFYPPPNSNTLLPPPMDPSMSGVGRGAHTVIPAWMQQQPPPQQPSSLPPGMVPGMVPGYPGGTPLPTPYHQPIEGYDDYDPNNAYGTYDPSHNSNTNYNDPNKRTRY